MNVACRLSLDSCIFVTHTELCCGLFVKIRLTAGKSRTVSSNTMYPADSPYTAVCEFTQNTVLCRTMSFVKVRVTAGKRRTASSNTM
jgi:hypothetical protein